MGKKYADGGQVKPPKAEDIVPTDSVQAPSLASVDGSTGFAGGLATGISNGRAMKEYKTQVDARKPKAMADGGSVSDKERGLKASSGEKVGFWQRIKMGNIDQEGSKASEAFGAGRGRAERQMDQLDKDMAPARAKPMAAAPAPAAPTKTRAERDKPGASGEPVSAPAASKPAASKPAVPTKAVAATPPKPSASVMRRPTGSVGEGSRAIRNIDAAIDRKAAQAGISAAAAPRPAPAPTPKPKARWEENAERLMEETASKAPSAPAAKAEPKKSTAVKWDPKKVTGGFENFDTKFKAPTIGYANGGMVGGNRSYGKKC
jgi:hypothetical protein